MSRAVRDPKLDTRTARLALPAAARRNREPYWRAIEPGCHLGYYKGLEGGTWHVRLYHGGRYHKAVLGRADDHGDADGTALLSFRQAQDLARRWCVDRLRLTGGVEPVRSGPYTVGDAIEEYLTWLTVHRRSARTFRPWADRHIRPALGPIPVRDLTAKKIRDWHEGVAQSQPFIRGARGALPRQRIGIPTAEDQRRRKATANGVLTVLKAALNRAFRDGKVASDDAWRRVLPFRDVTAPLVRYITDAEARQLVHAATDDFRDLVSAALLTGCRYGELTRLRGADFDPSAALLTIRTTKSGKPRHVVLTEEGRALFARLCRAKAPGDLLLRRANGAAWSANDQQRPLRAACAAADIRPAIGFHVLRHTYASRLAMQAVPLAVIARQLGHADSRITERHYAHLAPNYVAETIRAGFGALGLAVPAPTPLLQPA